LWLKRQFGPRLCRRVNEKRLKQLLADCSSPILLNNNAGPSTKLFSDTDNPVWESTLDGNKAAPLMMIPVVLPKMAKRKFDRIKNITSAIVTTSALSCSFS